MISQRAIQSRREVDLESVRCSAAKRQAAVHRRRSRRGDLLSMRELKESERERRVSERPVRERDRERGESGLIEREMHILR